MREVLKSQNLALTPTLTLGLVEELAVFELLTKLTLCGT
jgi:hypothetical protein